MSIGSPGGDRNMMEKEDGVACTGGCVDYPVVFVVPLFSVQDLMWFAKVLILQLYVKVMGNDS